MFFMVCFIKDSRPLEYVRVLMRLQNCSQAFRSVGSAFMKVFPIHEVPRSAKSLRRMLGLLTNS